MEEKYRAVQPAANEAGTDRSELDRFWDIEALLPNAGKPVRRPTAKPAPTVLVTADDSRHSSDPPHAPIPQRSSIPRRAAGAETGTSQVLYRYEPESSLIRSVTVSTWPTAYRFYDAFLADANRLRDRAGTPCPYVPFFAFIPQYSHLNAKQAEYYFYFRSCVRSGVFPEADISYVLLLLYEILNLADDRTASADLSVMCDLWSAYRNSYPILDKYLTEWICDFCLIYRLAPPLERIEPFLPKVLPLSTLKEFYLDVPRDGNGEERRGGHDSLARVLERNISGYNWRSSRAVTEENRELFRRHVPGALSYLLSHSESEVLTSLSPVPHSVQRDAFTAAVCSSAIKRRMDIEYDSLEHSIELKAVVTAAVKYTENRIRLYSGQKSRLKVPPIPPAIEKPLAEYLDREMPVRSGSVGRYAGTAAEIPAYEKRYDAESTGFDPDAAHEIESSSWRITELLTVSEPQEEPQTQTRIPEPEKPGPAEQQYGWDALFQQLTGDEAVFLSAMLAGASAPDAAKKAGAGLLPMALADAINEKAVETAGDILLEEDGDNLTILDDYREEVKASFRLRTDGAGQTI